MAKTQVLTPAGVRTITTGASGSSIFDVTEYGAVPNDPTNDVSVAYYNALAALSYVSPVGGGLLSGRPAGVIYFPTGTYYTSRPLSVPAGARIQGDGVALTTIAPGSGGPSNPSLVPGFSGPVIMTSNPLKPTDIPAPTQPVYEAPLVGAVGQSLKLNAPVFGPLPYLGAFYLHDSYPWGVWMGNDWTLTNWSVRFWVRIDNTPGGPGTNGEPLGIVGSYGPPVWQVKYPNLPRDSAFFCYLQVTNVAMTLTAGITTNPAYTSLVQMQPDGTQHSVSHSITSGLHHIELDYDGTHFYLYIDGVMSGSTPATGPIIRAPWEETTIGARINESTFSNSSVTGAIYSLQLSNIARHTGANFTPPVSAHTWDANTMALYNFDQPDPTLQPTDGHGNPVGPPLTLQFLVGQVKTGVSPALYAAPTLDGPLPHYFNYWNATFVGGSFISDLSVECRYSCTGIKVNRANRTWIERVMIGEAGHAGITCLDGESFFCHFDKVQIGGAVGRGMAVFGTVTNCETLSGGIGLFMISGEVYDFANQPTFTSYAGFACYSGGVYQGFNINEWANDAEANVYTRQVAVAVIGGVVGSWASTGCQWNGGDSLGPVMLFTSSQPTSNPGAAASFISTADVWIPTQRIRTDGIIKFVNGGAAQSLLVESPSLSDGNDPPIPWSNIPGVVAVHDAVGFGNVRGISISETRANNLAGTFQVLHGFNWGVIDFATPEPNTSYNLNVTPLGYLGSAPAAGSNRVVRIERYTDHAIVYLEADPGGTCTREFAWTLVRVNDPPIYFDYAPTVPSSFANPFSGETNTAFAIAATFIPVSGHTFRFVPINETFFAAGDPLGAANTWGLSSDLFVFLHAWLSTYQIQASTSVINGKLINWKNPGAHNFGIAYDGRYAYILIDGQSLFVDPGIPLGTQPAMVFLGERADTTQPLVSATARNLKMDRLASLVYSYDQDIGPGLQDQGVFVGDYWSTGTVTTTNPSWAVQIQNGKYGSTYYWMCDGSQVAGPFGSKEILWKPWGGSATAPAFKSACVLLGYYDMIAGTSATDTWAAIKEILEGTPATVYWNPPLSVSTPQDLRAWVLFGVQQSNVSTQYTVNGNTVTVPWAGTVPLTTDAVVAALNAVPAITALFNVAAQAADPTHASLQIQAKAAGAVGNGYVISTDGNGGAVAYGDQGGYLGAALSAKTSGGIDCTAIIDGISFVTNFTTDATTTINNFISAIAANVTLNARYTATNTGSQMKLTRRVNGTEGNTHKVGGVSFNTAVSITNPWTSLSLADGKTSLYGGSNGLISIGANPILLCTVPPLTPYDATKDAQRVALNALISAYVDPSVTIVDFDFIVRDPGTPSQLLPAYNDGVGTLNDAGNTAVYAVINPLLP